MLELASDDNSGFDGKTSVITFPVAPGISYYIAVDGVKGVFGTVVMSNILAQPPVILKHPQTQSLVRQNATGITKHGYVAGSNIKLSVTATNTLAQTPLFYQWQKNGLKMPNATNNFLEITNSQPSDAGVYVVQVSNFAGSIVSQPVTVDVSVPVSIANDPQDQIAIVGESVRWSILANGSDPISYQWYYNGQPLQAAQSNGLELSNIHATQSGGYFVTASNSAGFFTSKTAQLTVLEPVAITQSPGSVTTVEGGNVLLSAQVSGTLPIGYQWSLNGFNINGANSDTLSITSIKASQAGNYFVVASNSVRSVVSDQARVIVNMPVLITEQPQSRTVIGGIQASFSVTASGSGDFTYQWRFMGTPILAATNRIYSISKTQSNDAGNYDVVVQNSSGTVISSTAVLKVIVAPSITRQPVSLKLTAGTDLSFTVEVSGTAPLSYQWQRNGQNIAGATSSIYKIANAQSGHAGEYLVRISNEAGTAVSDTASLQVQVEVALKIVSITRSKDGTFDLLLSGPLGQDVMLEYSGNLGSWTPLTRITMNNGQVFYKDIRATGLKTCYYRLVIDSTETIPLIIETLRKSGANHIYLKLTGPPDASCIIQMSSDFKSWMPVYTNSMKNGILEWTDTGVFENKPEFYRGVIKSQ